MSDSEYDELSMFLVKNKDMFAKSMYDLPGTDVVQHKIDTWGLVPPRQRLYRTTPAAKREIEKQVKEMLEHGIIEESKAAYGANVVLIQKKDGAYRFAVDYRQLNLITKEMVWPLVTLEDVVDSLSEATPRVFSVLDLRSGYQQILLEPESREKSTFITHMGSFQYLRLPFGLLNSGAAFGQMMYSVLKNIMFKYILSYVDDCFIYSSCWRDHMEHLREVFRRLREARLKLHPKKCQFGVRSVSFLGHTISDKGLAPDPEKIKVMKEFPAPKNQKALRSYIGLTNFYRRYVRGYSHVVAPLLRLLKNDTQFVWDQECQNAFDKLKEAMTTAPILRLPVMGQKFYLLTDASATAIGYCLAQKNEDDVIVPCQYGGRSMTLHERNYGISERELLAVLEGVKHFSTFLSNQEFEVLSDHAALAYLQSIKATSGRLGRWGLYLQGFRFKITHIAGTKHRLPDNLSRREYTEEPKSAAEEEFESMLMNMNEALDEIEPPKVRPKRSIVVQFEYKEKREEVIAAVDVEEGTEERMVLTNELTDIGPLQRACPDSKDMIIFIEQGILPEDEQKARKIALTRENYEMMDGKLYFISRPRNPKIAKFKPVVRLLHVPRALRGEIVESYHHNNGHIGLEKLHATITAKYHWNGIWQDLLEVTKACTSCEMAKKTTRPKFAPLHVIPPGDTFFFEISYGYCWTFGDL